jgi:hypothetical protein
LNITPPFLTKLGNLPRFMETQAELWLEIAWAAAKFLDGFYDRHGEVAIPQLKIVTCHKSAINWVSNRHKS